MLELVARAYGVRCCFPTVELWVLDPNGFIFVNGYLTFCRNYFQISSLPFPSFPQISSTYDVGDVMGSSPIIEYRKILDNLSREEVKSLLYGQAVLAIEKWLANEKKKIKIQFGDNAGVDRDFVYIGTEHFLTDIKSVMDKFFDDCYECIQLTGHRP